MLFMDHEGRLLDANPAAEQAYGYSRTELLALTITELRAPDNRGDLHLQMTEADERGIIFETAHRRKDGSVFPVEVSARGATIGGRRTILSVVRDISERKGAEETLSRNLATLARSQEIGHIGSWALDFETGAFEASDEDYRIYGLVPGSTALLDLVWKLIHPDDLDRFREYVESVQHEGRLGGIEYRIVRPDGAVRHVYAETANVVRGSDGRVRLASGITQDITERKLAELEVLERARLSDALTSIDALVHSSLDTERAVEAALSEGAVALGASTAVVTTHVDGGFRIDHLFGAPAEELGRIVPDEHDPPGLAALATREPVVIEDAQADPRMSPVIAERYGVRSLLVVPLRAGEHGRHRQVGIDSVQPRYRRALVERLG
jgi:PAS domain S-box-containing protein